MSGWSLLGQYPKGGRNSYFGMALALLVAMETFNSQPARYKIWMCVLILASALIILQKAAKSKAILGIATSLFSLIWLLPIFNSDIFYAIDGWFFAAHSILSLAAAVGAFTYLKN